MVLRRIIFLLTLASLVPVTAQTTRVFVVAHPDDWQLFMNPNVYYSIQEETAKTVIIQTTSGDAGHGNNNGSYANSREGASLTALRFLSNAYGSGKHWGDEMSKELVSVAGHSLLRYGYKGVEMYFLRLPDGNVDGSGYPLHQSKSLEKFFKREVVDLQTIDQKNTYSNKEDLIGTLKALILMLNQKGSLEIHLADTDTEVNPGEHSDHFYTSKFLQEALDGSVKGEYFFYAEYHTSNLAPNLEHKELLVNAGCWGATASKLGDSGQYTTWDDAHNSWLDKQYFRVSPIID